LSSCLERAELLEQRAAVFGPMPGTPGMLSRAVAGQREQVAELRRQHAPLLEDVGGADQAVLHRVPEQDRRALLVADVDQLHQVLVGRDDDDALAGPLRLHRVGRDDVVGLDAGLLDHRQAERGGRPADQRELRDEVLGRRRALGLVGGVQRVAVAGAAVVEHREQDLRRVVLADAPGPCGRTRGRR
jgi:hypothetical protein